jgi:uncharacterized protein YndB with AHSA1/START domain
MEHGSIEREIQIEAPPEVVFEVITQPEHIKDWWAPDELDLTASPGAQGELVWGDRADPASHVQAITVVDVDPPRRFSFRWIYPVGEVARDGNSLLVTFDLEAQGSGTLLRMSETGYREKGWEVAVLEKQYQDNVEGWGYFLPRIAEHATKLAASR